MDTEREISSAAEELTSMIAVKLGDLADHIMGRPESGSAEWIAWYEANKNNEPWALNITRDWHLTKLAIARQAGTSPVGDVINAREYGATWQAIADVYGVSRQAAYDRWAKYSYAV